TRWPKNDLLSPDKVMNPPKPSLDDLRIERKAKPDSRTRIWPVIITLVALGLVAGAVWFLTRTKTVEVRTVLARQMGGQGSEHTVLNASGYITARRQATVSSKVTGKVIEVLIEEGMKVPEGQVLARLDDTNVKT